MKPETLFENFFDSIHITDTRLHNFADGTANRLRQDPGGQWMPLVSEVETAAAALGREIGEVDSTVNIRMGHTDTVDEILQQFTDYMSENEPFIARAVGGKASPYFTEFYPAGMTEYTKINKTSAPVLLDRILKASAKYAVELGAPLAAGLAAFPQRYTDARNAQQGVKGNVAENRTDRSDARHALEIALMRAIFQVGNQYPGDVDRCKSFFDFERLYRRGSHQQDDADLPPGA